MKLLKNVIANNLASLRKKSKLTQLELAEKLNYSDKAVSKWETGETTPPIEILKSLASFYNVSVDAILDENFDVNKAVSMDARRASHVIITLLSIMSVWLIATTIFTIFLMVEPKYDNAWLMFIYAVPCTALLVLIFVAIWGQKHKVFLTCFSSSVLLWTIILAIYLSFVVTNINIWMLWIIGVPIQVILILSFSILKKA